jgi:hypothetical protein
VKDDKIYWNSFRSLRQLNNKPMKKVEETQMQLSWRFQRNLIAIYVSVSFMLLHDFNHFHAALSISLRAFGNCMKVFVLAFGVLWMEWEEILELSVEFLVWEGVKWSFESIFGRKFKEFLSLGVFKLICWSDWGWIMIKRVFTAVLFVSNLQILPEFADEFWWEASLSKCF